MENDEDEKKKHVKKDIKQYMDRYEEEEKIQREGEEWEREQTKKASQVGRSTKEGQKKYEYVLESKIEFEKREVVEQKQKERKAFEEQKKEEQKKVFRTKMEESRAQLPIY